MPVYTPTAAPHSNFPAVTDGSVEAAALFAPFLEGLADEVAYVADGGDASALNWEPGGATLHLVKRLAYCIFDGTWFGASNLGSDSLESSVSFGRSWTDISGSLGASKSLLDVATGRPATSPDDAVLVITTTRDVYVGTRTAFATYTWALVANALTAAPSGGSLSFEPTSGLFVACYRVTTTGMRLDTWDGSTFTARTLPASFTSFVGTSDPEVGTAPGKAIAIFPDTTGTSRAVHVAYSTDAITWASATATSGALNAGEDAKVTRPIYDANTGAWFFALSGTAVDKSEVFKSTDGGATWAICATMIAKDVEVRSACMIGPVWTMCTTKGRIMASKDGGVSWRWVGAIDGTAGIFTMADGGGGALVVNAVDQISFFSARAGQVIGQLV